MADFCQICNTWSKRRAEMRVVPGEVEVPRPDHHHARNAISDKIATTSVVQRNGDVGRRSR